MDSITQNIEKKLIENWTDITGEIMSTGKSHLRNFDAVLIKISDIRPFKDYPNLLESYSLSEIELSIHSSVLKKFGIIKPGDMIRALVRESPGESYFVKPDSVERIG